MKTYFILPTTSTAALSLNARMRYEKTVFVLPADFHTRQFGFFCKQELRMQRAHIPLSFRLGNMDMCNLLEQKKGY